MELLAYLFVCVVIATVFGFLGSFIADQKGRSSGEGFLLGFLFGPLGCLIEVLLPNIAPPPAFRNAARSNVFVPEMPEDWGKPGRSESPREVPDDGVDMEWLKSP